MVFKESFETIREAEKEIQKLFTYLEEHEFYCQKHLENDKLLSAYKEEAGIEKRLLFLNGFLQTENKELEKEIKTFRKAVAAESIRLKCKQIESWIQSDFVIEDDEDFGDEDE